MATFGKSVKVSLTPVVPPSDEDEEKNEFGPRIPPRPLTGIIDFESDEIIFSRQVEDILSYEIWNEDRTVLFYSGDNESEFIQVLSGFDGPVAVIIHTLSYMLTGYMIP